jgi:protein SCO1
VLSGVLALGACGHTAPQSPVANLQTQDGDGMHGAVLDRPYTVPAVSLTDTDGRRYSLRTHARKPLTLVFFGYTHCPDLCQVVMADIASALNRLDAADRSRVGMLFVTSDPARDDPQTLRTYLDRFDPTFEGLTGPLPRIVRVANALGVPVERGAKLPSGGYDVAHGTQVVGLGSDSKARIVWTEGTSSSELAQDVTDLLARNG